MLTLEELKRIIEEEKKKYESPYKKDSGFEECKKYVESNHLTKAEHLLDIDIWECFKCLLYLKSRKEIPMEKCRQISEMSKETFENLDYDTYEMIIDMLFIIADLKEKEQILDYLKEPSKIKALTKIASIQEYGIPLSKLTRGELQDGNLKSYLKKLRELELSHHTLEQIIRFIGKDTQLASDLYSFVKAQKRMRLEKKVIDDCLRGYEFMIRDKDKSRTTSQIFGKLFSTQHIVAQQNIIYTFIHEEERKESDSQKENQRMIRNCNKTLDLLEKAAEKEEITNARELVRSVPNEEIKRQILKWVYEKNQAYYQRLEHQLKELSMNSISQYLGVLNRYKIPLHPKDVSTITKNSPEDLEIILSMIPLSSYELEKIIEILQTTTKERVEKIKKLVDSRYIDYPKVRKNYTLYNEKDTRVSRIEATIEFLNQFGINPKQFSSVPELLWDDTGILRKNIELLDSYNLIRSIKTTTSYGFLQEENLEEKLDLYTELGHYSELEMDIGLLNVPLERIKRLELLSKMNIPVEDIEALSDVLENNKFMIPDSEIDNYILDFASFKQSFDLNLSLEKLQELSSDKITIELNGVIFSLPKIRRRVEKGDSLMDAIFYGKRMTEEEYNLVIEALKPHIMTKK